MDYSLEEVRRELFDIIQSVKSAVTRPSRVGPDEEFETIRDLAMQVEGVLMLVRRINMRGVNIEVESVQISERIISETKHILRKEKFFEYLKQRRFRYVPGALNRGSSDTRHFTREDLENLTLADALQVFIQLVEGVVAKGSLQIALAFSPAADVVKLRKIVPAQKIAPVQFEIKDNVLTIAQKKSTPEAIDLNNVSAAHATLVESGNRIIDNLNRSNCDKRLIETFTSLQSVIESGESVVKLGLINSECEFMCGKFEKELPDALHAMLRAQTVGVSLYVAQFPEWQRFTENARLIELLEADVTQIRNTGRKLVQQLRNNIDIVDPEVPRTVAYLLSMIEDPTKTTKRSAFAVLRTIENLVAKIFSYGVSFIDQSVCQLGDNLSKSASKIIVIGLLGLAVDSATGLSSVAVKLGDSAWMESAVQIVRRQIETLKTSN